jgi:phosphatidate cytidylyltransferase
MPLDTTTFRIRTTTAVLFAAVMLTGLFWNQWSYFILFSIIHFGCWKEYHQIISKIDPAYEKISVFHKYGIRIAGWSLVLFFTNYRFTLGSLPLHALGLWLGITFLFILPLIELLFSKQIRLRNIFYSSAGFLYLSLPCALCMDLFSVGPIERSGNIYVLPEGYTVILIVFAIWINDTMAYLVGSLIGKHPLSTISPKKTWEGTIGGILLSVAILTTLFYNYASMQQLVFAVLLLLLIVTIAGTLGDLLESKLKRMAGIKDSGKIMPGHGGFLDRFDSLLLAIPFSWLFIRGYLTLLSE